MFKTGTYLLFWKKYKKRFITLFISIILVAGILSIYTDMFNILKLSDKQDLWQLLFVKYILLFLIIATNIYILFFSKKPNSYKQETITKKPEIKLSKTEENILKKEKLQSRSDYILRKYQNFNDI
jgi:hypothetical protein